MEQLGYKMQFAVQSPILFVLLWEFSSKSFENSKRQIALPFIF